MSSKKTDAKEFGVKICNSPDGDETTMVFYDTTEKKLKVDSTKSSSGRSSGSVESAPLELGSTEGLKLRIFVDKSIVEVFANSRQAIARHIFPENENSTGVKVFSKNADTLITKFESWQIAPSNPY